MRVQETPGASPELRHEILSFIEEVEFEGIHGSHDEHYAFADGGHGFKLYGDVIERSPHTFARWVDLHEMKVNEIGEPDVPIISVANGTVGLVDVLSWRMGVQGYQTVKQPGTRDIQLTHLTKQLLEAMQPDHLRIIDDIGSTGSQALKVARLVTAFASEAEFKPPTFDAMYTWQRSSALFHLQQADITTHVLYKEEIPIFTPEDCQRLPEGLCAQGIPLK